MCLRLFFPKSSKVVQKWPKVSKSVQECPRVVQIHISSFLDRYPSFGSHHFVVSCFKKDVSTLGMRKGSFQTKFTFAAPFSQQWAWWWEWWFWTRFQKACSGRKVKSDLWAGLSTAALLPLCRLKGSCWEKEILLNAITHIPASTDGPFSGRNGHWGC